MPICDSSATSCDSNENAFKRLLIRKSFGCHIRRWIYLDQIELQAAKAKWLFASTMSASTSRSVAMSDSVIELTRSSLSHTGILGLNNLSRKSRW